MSYELIRSRVSTEISAATITQDGVAAKFKWAGMPDSSDAPYVGISIEDAITLPCVGNTQRRYVGNIIFMIITPSNTGTRSERETADLIVSHFGNKLINGIQYGSPSTSMVSNEQFNLFVPYQFDN